MHSLDSTSVDCKAVNDGGAVYNTLITHLVICYSYDQGTLPVITTVNKRRGRLVNTPASGGPGFKFRLGDRLSSLRFFVGFLSSSKPG
jgi:hypothetical protein